MGISIGGAGILSSIVINGQSYSGTNIQINGDKVVIDGKASSQKLRGDVSIVIVGNVQNINTTSGDVTVNGSAKSIQTTSGDVSVEQNCTSNISTVSGDVTISGTNIGNINTISGDIKSGVSRNTNPPDTSDGVTFG